jgi:methyl-accepting chemotaxis protein
MKLSDFRVTTKLYVGFIAVVAVFMLSAAYLINNTITLGKMQDEGSSRAKDALHVVENEKNLQEVYGMIADAIINRDLNKSKAELMEDKKKILQDISEIKKIADTAEEKEWAGKIEGGYNKYFALIENDLLPLLEKNAGMEEVAKLDAKVDTIRNEIGKYLTDFSKSISNESDAADRRFDDVRDASIRLSMILNILGIILAFLIAFFITRSITGPLNRVIAGLTDGADQVSSAAGQVSSSSQSLAEGTSEQASSLEETSSSLEEMSAMTKQNAENANQAKAMMSEARQIVEKVDRHMKDMAGAVAEITRSSEETGKIIKTIDEIAFQTNLLALNAAVEAARAGEAGTGFAVVADEVRNLAIRAAEAAKNTSNLIENTIKAVRKGNELTNATQEAFKENAEISRKIGQLVDEIAAASEEQSHGITQVNTAVSEMDKVTQSTAANAEESAAAAEELNAQAEQMKIFVGDLVTVVGGSANGADSRGRGGGFRREQVGSSKAALPEKKAGRPLAIHGKVSGKITHPEQVIPMNDEEFKDF